MCVVDEDQAIMFQLMATLRPLGIRDNAPKFDLEFPSRNQLKCFLAQQITKERKQLRQGYLDADSVEHDISIISSTDFTPGTTVSTSCKRMYKHTPASKEGTQNAARRTPRHSR